MAGDALVTWRAVEGGFAAPTDKAITHEHPSNWQALRDACWSRHV